MTVLVIIPVNAGHIEKFNAAATGCEVIFTREPTDAQLAQAEIIVGNPPLQRLEGASQLRLLQLQSAGVGAYASPCLSGRGVHICNASGSYGLAISEHMLGMLLGLQKRLFAYRDQQFEGVWKDLGPVGSVNGANVLVLGMGDIGGSFARLCHAFGARVTGIRRSAGDCPEYCEQVGVQADADRYLPDADIVFMCMPETEQTIRFMNRDRLQQMKQGAIFLNAGRGTAVDTDALAEALASGHLGGAGLDVTDPEPLPPEHPLWKCPNACITPHVSGGMHLQRTHDNIVDLACRNIRAWLSGAALTSEVNYKRGY